MPPATAPVPAKNANSASRAPAHTPSNPSHPCRLCGRVYERADHLNRHLKSHENARPHKCSRCPKSFNRVDLLNRHQAGHDKQRDGKIIERGERVSAACLACVSAKAKCQDQKPCTRCQQRGILCEATSNSISVVEPDLGDAVSKHQISDGQAQVQHPSHNSPSQNQDLPLDYGNSLNQNSGSRDIHSSLLNPGLPEDTLADDAEHNTSMYDEHPMNSGLNPSSFELTNISYMTADQHFSLEMGGLPLNAHMGQDLGFGVWDFDLDNFEMSLPDFDSVNSHDPTLDNNTVEPQPGKKRASKRYAAFERSPWLWTPTQKDQALNDQHHLNLDEDTIPPVLTPACSPQGASMNQFIPSIGHRQRDQMLSLLLTLRQLPKPAPRFPSLSMLNSLIQVYFSQDTFRFESLIHPGTFSSTNILPQLLIAIASAGSTLISIPAIWKMGLALQEVVRHTVADYWEEDNRNTRDLQALQAFIIALDVGLWSGFRRNMELAESFSQPVITMMRRGGAFGSNRNEILLIPSFDDSPTALQSKWEKWAEKESLKRLVIHIFMHDTHASMGLQKPPLVSFTELKVSLPASRMIWIAETAMEWRDRYLSAQSKPATLPSLIDAMQSPESLHTLSLQIDVHLTAMTLLHGYWGQIWSLMEAKKFFPTSKSTHRLAIHTSHTELYRDLSSFSQHLGSLTRNSSEALLISELFMMILHVSPDELQRFAGKFGEDEAQKAGRGFADWANTMEARIAVWHAGQVFRAAKLLVPANNRGFNSIALYFASLTLWAYGLMTSRTSRTRPPTPQNARPSGTSIAEKYPNQDQVVLNEPESLYAQVFRTAGHGLPGIMLMEGGSEQFLELKNADRVLDVARDIYKNNYPVSDEPLPPLVENLGNLLRDLGNLSSSYGSRLPSESPA